MRRPGIGTVRPEAGNFVLGSARTVIWNLFLIGVGSILVAIAINGVLIPHHFLSGGLAGVVLGINYMFPQIPVSVCYFALNIPIFIAGWKFVGKRFFWYSVIGMLALTAALEWVQITLPVHDNILAAILGGIIMGVGSGGMLQSRGSGGGLDIVSVVLLNRFSIGVGNTYLGANIIILTIATFMVSLDATLYTLIYMFVGSKVIDLVLTGLSRRKVLLIISPEWKKISREILRKVNRGVTHLQGQGGYTGREEKVLYTVVTMRELSRVKNVIRQIDPNAFVVINNTQEVMGQRIGNQPHW
ncbi:YitT family protein [Desulfonema ishimotonii]|uniref:YitT family protein n=2 Tax=Desulfonema ishimotonii TaxID=45657 RepID=A0A401FVI9_9BACT|nr:YitT family protein [Desulfonema ishimotonii]